MALETQSPAPVPTAPNKSPTQLEDQAAIAALYIKSHDEATQIRTGHEFLDSNHKLSAAGAATSLRYANPQDLPSFPSSGLRPDPSVSASAAALRAKDYKMAPLWQPEQSAHGAKAALLAHKDTPKIDIWQPESSVWGNSAALLAFKKYGAGGLSPVLDYGYTEVGRRGSLLAATGAMSQGRKRAESTPVTLAPKIETYPDERNSNTNALRAAESAARQQKRSVGSFEQGAIPFTAMPREMFTSHPPVAPEVEEADRQDTIHASAVAMAKNMYSLQQKQQKQQKQVDTASSAYHGAVTAHARRFSMSASVDEVQPARYSNLQEAAQKLAQERLAKLHDEHAQNREYRDYYAAHGTHATLSRFTGRGRTRRRASSDVGINQDIERSNKIRAQMSQFSNNVSQIDAKKRQQDREALIAAAQRNVTKQLHGMDERVFADTGKVPPSLLSQWEVKANAAAQEQSDSRMENYGKVHVGGGKFVDQSTVDEVAQKNVQPVLDEIYEKAEAEKERRDALKLEQDTEARKATEKKARDKESKEINKKLKQQDKEAEKIRKNEEKNARKDEARRSKEKRRSGKYESTAEEPAAATTIVGEPEERNAAQSIEFAGEPLATAPDTAKEITTAPATTAPATTEPATTEPATTEPITVEPVITEPIIVEPVITHPVVTAPVIATSSAGGLLAIGDKPPRAAPHPPGPPEPTPIRTSMEDQASLRMRENAARVADNDSTPLSPTSGDGKVKKWFKTKFSRRLSRSNEKPLDKGKEKEEGFVGGATLAGEGANGSTASLERPDSVRDVALAGKARKEELIAEPGEVIVGPSDHCTLEESLNHTAKKDKPKDVPKDEPEPEDHFQEARDRFDEDLVTPPTFPVAKEASPVRDSRFIEEI